MPELKPCKCGRRPYGIIIHYGMFKKYQLECVWCGIKTMESRLKFRIARDWNKRVGE